MNRLNGANCLVYLNDGRYVGSYLCIIEIENNEIVESLINHPIANTKKVKIIVKNIRKSLSNCKLTIFNNIKGEFYALKNYEVKTEGINDEDAWFIDEEENIISKIKKITKEDYEQLKTTGILNIEWDKIKTLINGDNVSKDKAFEYLCTDLINTIKPVKEGNFHPRGGTDAGRDYIWKWSAIDNPNIDFLDLPNETWIMQCKYSENPKQKLIRTEVWDEIVKVIQHNPNHYIIFTNRNITAQFKDWWDEVSRLDSRENKFIPFSLHLVGREDIERLLNLYHEIKEKYFG